MTGNVAHLRAASNGDDGAETAMCGISVTDAAFHTAHDYPGGIPALAQRMGMSQNTLQHKVNTHNTTHHLGLHEAVKMMVITGDNRIAQAVAAAGGGVLVNMVHDSSGMTIEKVMGMSKEFADILGAVADCVRLGKVSVNDMHACEKQAAELMAAVNGVLGSLRGQMRGIPGGLGGVA